MRVARQGVLRDAIVRGCIAVLHHDNHILARAGVLCGNRSQGNEEVLPIGFVAAEQKVHQWLWGRVFIRRNWLQRG